MGALTRLLPLRYTALRPAGTMTGQSRPDDVWRWPVHVMTVTGPIAPDEMGVTLPHEHLLLDMDWPGLWPDVSHRPDLVWQRVDITNLGEIRRNYMAVRDNALLADVAEMSEEVGHFRAAGGGTIAEMTTLGLKPDPAGLAAISRRSGVHIIAGTGFYTEETLSAELAALDVREMQALMVRDLTEGFPGTGVKAGVIGEIALNRPIKPAEERALRAAARAQWDTGAALCIHGISPEAIGILQAQGADLTRVVACHQDGITPERARVMADLGIYIEFDCFGHEFYCDNGAYDADWPWHFSSDAQRVAALVKLVEAGYAGQLLLSHDICVKMQLRRYGSNGYAHVLENIAPMLRYAGVTDEQIRTMTVDNPAQLFPIP
jgi:phosphotriesterase-related protein